MRNAQITLRPGLELRTDVDANVPKMMRRDPLRLRQVLQNIIVNAIKFTDFGYIDVKAKVVKERCQTIEILNEVIDSGIGVARDAVKSLFRPFVQLDDSSTKKFKGTGLGLSICKSLVELMGSNIGYFLTQLG